MEFSMSRPCERRDPSVSAIALIAAARTLVSALEQRPFFTFEARGDGSLRSQGRPDGRGFAQSLSGSSLRTQGPITPGLKSEKRPLLQCRNESPRRMGPCVRRDDSLKIPYAIALPASGRGSSLRLLPPLVSNLIPL